MPSRDGSALDRRTLLALLGTSSAVALAGCGGDGGNGGDDGNGDSPDATLTDEVPDEYETATALNGQQRDPGSLSSKDAVSYQDQPEGGQQCSGCAFYIPDKNGDDIGACAIVEGNIEPDGYCVSYVEHEDGGDNGDTVQAVDVPEDATCAVCDMNVANFPEWNAQTVHTDDTREFFCTSGCATTYYAATDEFAETDANIAGLWVRDFETRELVDGTSAYYALETDSDRLDDPMRLNPAPFANRDDAVAYVDEVDNLTEDDIVELSAFDRDLASQYRGRFLE
jgi:nitrous oxide reductase accessory protein NosL